MVQAGVLLACGWWGGLGQLSRSVCMRGAVVSWCGWAPLYNVDVISILGTPQSLGLLVFEFEFITVTTTDRTMVRTVGGHMFRPGGAPRCAT